MFELPYKYQIECLNLGVGISPPRSPTGTFQKAQQRSIAQLMSWADFTWNATIGCIAIYDVCHVLTWSCTDMASVSAVLFSCALGCFMTPLLIVERINAVCYVDEVEVITLSRKLIMRVAMALLMLCFTFSKADCCSSFCIFRCMLVSVSSLST